ncbi:MAG: hypothetical protein HQM00_04660, partial [Magnetococcales bacterium]|nr:hypothetical protein [Magnetococcales bacterium]
STMADGSSGHHAVARLDALRIGSREVKNVSVTVTPAKGMPLLGTPVLEQLGAWRIDPQKRQLLIPRLAGGDSGPKGAFPPFVDRMSPEGASRQAGGPLPAGKSSESGKPSGAGKSPDRGKAGVARSPDGGNGPEGRGVPADGGRSSGQGKTLRQCWRADGTSYLTAPPCPPGSEVVPITGKSRE